MDWNRVTNEQHPVVSVRVRFRPSNGAAGTALMHTSISDVQG